MRNGCLNKGLVVGIIVLFLLVGIYPTSAIDNTGNVEYPKNSFSNGYVQKIIWIIVYYEILDYNWLLGQWHIGIWVEAYDDVYDMDRLEIYFNDELKEIIEDSPWIFGWEFDYPPAPDINIKAVAYNLAGQCANLSVNLSEFKINKHSRDNFFNNHLMIENELREKSEIGGADDYKEIITRINAWDVMDVNIKGVYFIFRDVEIIARYGETFEIRGIKRPNGDGLFFREKVEYVRAPLFFGFILTMPPKYSTARGIAFGNIEWE